MVNFSADTKSLNASAGRMVYMWLRGKNSQFQSQPDYRPDPKICPSLWTVRVARMFEKQ